MGPGGPRREGTKRANAVAAGPLARERGADDVGGLTGEEANRPGSTVAEVPWRFSVAVPVLGGRGGGLAWVGVGGHGGRVNLVGECSGRSILDEVAGSRGGEVAGGATGHNRRRSAW
jgi:hypothetical protein